MKNTTIRRPSVRRVRPPQWERVYPLPRERFTSPLPLSTGPAAAGSAENNQKSRTLGPKTAQNDQTRQKVSTQGGGLKKKAALGYETFVSPEPRGRQGTRLLALWSLRERQGTRLVAARSQKRHQGTRLLAARSQQRHQGTRLLAARSRKRHQGTRLFGRPERPELKTAPGYETFGRPEPTTAPR